MHYLITGHTGFKGSWLTFLLIQRGHKVSGISLDVAKNSLFEIANVEELLHHHIKCDIRNLPKLTEALNYVNPDVLIHFAAQPLVRESYARPLETFETNAIGTINILSASQTLSNLKARLIITTDKVYRDIGKNAGYLEDDQLGGFDPYSASKAMADIATQSWVKSFGGPNTGIARAGNVIGGGDVCKDRLIPDLIKSLSVGEIPKLRSPFSVRPWQNVLDCLNGYLLLVDELVLGKASGEWNFGPDPRLTKQVKDVVKIAFETWGVETVWELDEAVSLPESSFLALDSSKAFQKLGWREIYNFEESVIKTIIWYKNVMNGKSPREETLRIIREFESKNVNYD